MDDFGFLFQNHKTRKQIKRPTASAKAQINTQIYRHLSVKPKAQNIETGFETNFTNLLSISILENSILLCAETKK